jgi:hypothetical protein
MTSSCEFHAAAVHYATGTEAVRDWHQLPPCSHGECQVCRSARKLWSDEEALPGVKASPSWLENQLIPLRAALRCWVDAYAQHQNQECSGWAGADPPCPEP